MNRDTLLKEMKDSVGTKDPVEFFAKFTDVFALLFDRMDRLERQTALAIHWDSKIASDMISKQVIVLRKDKDTYANEITELKKAFAEDIVTQNYVEFCAFWQDTLGFHPFLD